MNEIQISQGTERWVKFIKQRIKNNKNFMGVFIGQTGSGKSYGNLSLSDLIHDLNLPTENICFKASQFMKRLDEGLENGTLKKGDVLVWDETGIDLNAKDWQSRTSKIISKVMQTFRTENIIVLFTVPYLDFISKDARKLIHAYFQTVKINRKKQVVIVKPFLIQTNQVTGKMYRKCLKVKLPTGGTVKVKTISLPKPRKELLDYYEDVASKFKRDIIKESRAEFDRMEEDKNNIKPIEYYQDMINKTIAQYPNTLNMTMKQWAIYLGLNERKLFRLGLNLIIGQIKLKNPIGNAVLVTN